MIKEYCEKAHRVVIRENNYGSSLEKFERLFREALQDFPFLNKDDVTIVHFGGNRYKKTFGIELSVENFEIPNDYVMINELEYTL